METIPKDVVESGSGITGSVRAIFYGSTENEVNDKKNKYLREYPPQGYSTNVDKSTTKYNNYWMCSIRRFASCD